MDYTTEDGVTVRTGDRVYNYYDMCPGTIGEDASTPREPGWFRFTPDDRTHWATLLNGARICSIPFAKLRGWPGA